MLNSHNRPRWTIDVLCSVVLVLFLAGLAAYSLFTHYWK